MNYCRIKNEYGRRGSQIFPGRFLPRKQQGARRHSTPWVPLLLARGNAASSRNTVSPVGRALPTVSLFYTPIAGPLGPPSCWLEAMMSTALPSLSRAVVLFSLPWCEGLALGTGLQKLGAWDALVPLWMVREQQSLFVHLGVRSWGEILSSSAESCQSLSAKPLQGVSPGLPGKSSDLQPFQASLYSPLHLSPLILPFVAYNKNEASG